MTQLIEQILSLSEEQKIQLIHALSERSAFRTVKAKLPFTIADADFDASTLAPGDVFESTLLGAQTLQSLIAPSI